VIIPLFENFGFILHLILVKLGDNFSKWHKTLSKDGVS
jgi:hypothetical protein